MLSHQIVHPFSITPHEHANVLQLDLIIGCTGRAYAEGRWQPIGGTTLLASAPGAVHGYELESDEQPSRVFHLKLRLDPGTAIPFTPLLTNLVKQQDLASALQVVCRLNLAKQLQSPLLIARLAEALCLWPLREPRHALVDAGTVHALTSDPAHSDLAGVIELIDNRVHDPPGLAEMARVAHYSPRHFARRFCSLFGCTPHAYVTARRLDHAQRLLLENRLKVHEIALSLGFSSVATFSRWFSGHVGRAPTAYRNDPRVL